MPYKTIDHHKLAKKHGIDLETIKLKQELIQKIILAREKKNLTQADLAKLLGKTQSYVAKIESGLGTRNFSLDLLLDVLNKLGIRCKITTTDMVPSKKLAA